MNIAVVGAGVSGLVAARLLCDQHDVCLFESAPSLGGHALTLDVDVFGARHSVDVGFMVYNDRTYPNFVKLLTQHDVPTRESDMSFSVRCDRSGQEYNGSSLNGLFARRTNLFRPSFLRMLRDIGRFFRDAPRDLPNLADEETVGSYVDRKGMGDAFCSHYLMPMAASIWSAPPRRVLEFPARFLIQFFQNHGLLQVTGHPKWRTIVGGARSYVERLASAYRHKIRLNAEVLAVSRTAHGVTVTTADGRPEAFDAVVMATHADITLRLLSDADDRETEILRAFPYQKNQAILHTDTQLLPARRQAWASWNYLVPTDPSGPVAITYDLSRLQGLRTPSPILLTLNRGTSVAPEKVLRELSFRHPVFDAHSLAAQRRHDEINGRRNTYFCGAYWGNGFHEDGVNSAVAVARRFGKSLQTCGAASMRGGWNTADTVLSSIGSAAASL